MQRWTAVLVLSLPSLSLSFGSPPPPPQTPSRATQPASRASALFSGGDAADGRDPAPPASSARAADADAAAARAFAENDAAHTPSLEALLAQAQEFLRDANPAGAFAALAQAYGIDPTSSRVAALFGACLRLKVELGEGRYNAWKRSVDESGNGAGAACAAVVALSEEELNEFFQDRMGLSSLSIDRERYDEAGDQLRKAIEEATFWLHRALLPSSQHHDTSDGKEGGGAAGPVDGPREDFSSTRFRHWQPTLDRARYLLYRTNAGCCHWDTYFADGDRLRRALRHAPPAAGELARMLHPFDALKFPCVSLALASDVARGYARRALESAGVVDAAAPSPPRAPRDGAAPPRGVVTARRRDPRPRRRRKIRIGYISPDFTARHPLAFLMQHVFRHHDADRFRVHVYSVASSDAEEGGPEVRAIRDASARFARLSPAALTPLEMYQTMLHDGVDVIVDLCGYAGTSVVAEAMASRCRLRQERPREDQRRFPVHVSYMGFPGSVGSARVWDYSVFDPVVVPPEARGGYDEALVYMPHCYFVNSHRTVLGEEGGGTRLAKEELRAKYGIHPAAFVYCCHSRPDKIDPSTFKSWMRALMRVQADGASAHPLRHRDAATTGDADAVAPVLWLLRSSDLMEQNLRRWVRQEFGTAAEDCLVFADVAERCEHLKRIGIADVFLDTPAYNAHTLGCDALYMGVPMISLLRQFEQNDDAATHPKLERESAADVNLDFGSERRSISTEKLASRVGASLLEAVGLEDLIYPDMAHYEDAMVRCALDKEWFDTVRKRLRSSKDSSPLFDTERWVQNVEAAFEKMVELDLDGGNLPDIVVSDDS